MRRNGVAVIAALLTADLVLAGVAAATWTPPRRLGATSAGPGGLTVPTPRLPEPARPRRPRPAPGDQQSFAVDVDPGTLTISTPFTVDHPLDLGALELDDDGALLRASTDLGLDHRERFITVTDTRPVVAPWDASVSATDFVRVGHSDRISAQNLSLTEVVPRFLRGNALQYGDVTTRDVTTDVGTRSSLDGEVIRPYRAGGGALSGAGRGDDGLGGGPHTFASAEVGPGTVFVAGRLTLFAPVDLPAGRYVATLSFTVI